VVEEKDEQLLYHWITRHAECTASPRARWILDNWTEMLPRFVKVFPHEYKRVLGVPRQRAESLTAAHIPAVVRQPEPVGRGAD